MGRCGGWIKIIALVLVTFLTSCGGTGGGPSDSGKPFVFEGRGRLSLIPQLKIEEPTVLTIIATLLDPQGNPFRNQRVTFEAEFPDATIVPANTPQNISLACLPPGSSGNATRCTNRGAAITNDLGQAQVTVIAGLTLGSMRITAEAPVNLNISSAISVNITSQGFIGSQGLFGILPTSVLFVNPLVGPETDPNKLPFTIFTAVGGFPPYRWDHTNTKLGRIDPQGIPNINQQAKYTLIGPIPVPDDEVLTDEVRITDSRGNTRTAEVTVIFATCTLQLSAATIAFNGAFGGETFDIRILDGVPPFTAAHTFPAAGTLTVNNTTAVVTYTVETPPLAVAPDNVLIRDSRGCVGTAAVTIVPGVAGILLTADPVTINGVTGGTSTITAFVFDNNNEPLADYTILFATDLGTLSAATVVTGADGKATVTLTIPAGTPAGEATVAALPPNSSTPAEVTVTITEPAP
ncbi:MAG: Ig-like domain-containing protein [Deltaproteobacteria bacterium]|nr:Ig-like domain-containing protein [Deltaproteobacteria bacterium]